MLIGEIAGAAGVSRDTVRYYVRLGLLNHKLTPKGGMNAYHIFDEQDLYVLRMIKVSQNFGMSLREIKRLRAEEKAGTFTETRKREVLLTRLADLRSKAANLDNLIRSLEEALESPAPL